MALQTSISGVAKSGELSLHAEVIGLEKAIAAAREFGTSAVKALGDALRKEAEEIIRESKQIVPVNKERPSKKVGRGGKVNIDVKAQSAGTLRASGHVQPTRREGGEIVVECGYGGPSIPYALRQHEELSYTHLPGLTAKYLWIPFARHAANMDERMAAYLRYRLSKRVR